MNCSAAHNSLMLSSACMLVCALPACSLDLHVAASPVPPASASPTGTSESSTPAQTVTPDAAATGTPAIPPTITPTELPGGSATPPTASPEPTATTDKDKDGYPALSDCDDYDPQIYPGAEELVANLTDDNCDGNELCYKDSDSDGFRPDEVSTVLSEDIYCTGAGEAKSNAPSGDCNDFAATINPDASEQCDSLDNDCDGLADESLAGLQTLEGWFVTSCVPASYFVRGSDDTDYADAPDEKPEAEVFVSGFRMDLVEVTNRAYAEFLNVVLSNESSQAGVNRLDLTSSRIHPGADSYLVEEGYEDHPVYGVSWYGALDFCQFHGAELPTEAQWEKAARGGCELTGTADCQEQDERLYPWGEAMPDCTSSNSSQCAIQDSWETGKHPGGVSLYGIFDMAGNVWEWTRDWYSNAQYQVGEVVDPLGPPTGQQKVMRGGSYLTDTTELRTANRGRAYPSEAPLDHGVRCVYPGP